MKELHPTLSELIIFKLEPREKSVDKNRNNLKSFKNPNKDSNSINVYIRNLELSGL